MRIRRFRILAALLSLLVAFHWLPGAMAASIPAFGVICGDPHASAAQDGAWQPGGDVACKHDCKLCSGTGASAPAIAPIPAASATVVGTVAAFSSPDLTSSLWAPVWARPPPRG